MRICGMRRELCRHVMCFSSIYTKTVQLLAYVQEHRTISICPPLPFRLSQKQKVESDFHLMSFPSLLKNIMATILCVRQLGRLHIPSSPNHSSSRYLSALYSKTTILICTSIRCSKSKTTNFIFDVFTLHTFTIRIPVSPGRSRLRFM
jgi:hypothetical protein